MLEVKIKPNMARNANIVGLAREVAALTGQPLRAPDYGVLASGPAMAGRNLCWSCAARSSTRASAAALIKGVTLAPSPYEVQRRLRLAGVRPINGTTWSTPPTM